MNYIHKIISLVLTLSSLMFTTLLAQTGGQQLGNGFYGENGSCINDGYAFSFDYFGGSSFSQLWKDQYGLKLTHVKDAENLEGILEVIAQDNGKDFQFTTLNFVHKDTTYGITNLSNQNSFSIRVKSDSTFDLVAAIGFKNDQGGVTLADKNFNNGNYSYGDVKREYVGGSGWQTFTFPILEAGLNNEFKDELVDKTKAQSILLSFRNPYSFRTQNAKIDIDWITIGAGKVQNSLPTNDCPKEEIYGCTNEFSPNYNPNATIDDGSCDKITATSTEIGNPMTLYPNPTSGVVNLILKESSFSVLKVKNIDGKVIISNEISNKNNISLDLNGQNRGIYFIELLGENENKILKVLKN